MAFLQGYGGQPVMIATGGPTASGASVPNSAAAQAMPIDGTPVRVVLIGFAAAAVIVALRMAGFKFNVAASS